MGSSGRHPAPLGRGRHRPPPMDRKEDGMRKTAGLIALLFAFPVSLPPFIVSDDPAAAGGAFYGFDDLNESNSMIAILGDTQVTPAWKFWQEKNGRVAGHPDRHPKMLHPPPRPSATRSDGRPGLTKRSASASSAPSRSSQSPACSFPAISTPTSASSSPANTSSSPEAAAVIAAASGMAKTGGSSPMATRAPRSARTTSVCSSSGRKA
jgi:hypothetical protein